MSEKKESTINVSLNISDGKRPTTVTQGNPSMGVPSTSVTKPEEEEEFVKAGQHMVSQLRHNVQEEDELIDLLWDKEGLSGDTVQTATREQKVTRIAETVANLTGANLEESVSVPDRLGLDLTPIQWDIVGFILKKFSQNNYHGDRQGDKSVVLSGVYSNGDHERLGRDNEIKLNGTTVGGPYKNIQHIPSVRFTPTELMEDLDRNSRSMYVRERVTENLTTLGVKPYLFMWKRLKKDKKGKPVVNKLGQYDKEIVMEVSPLLRVQKVFEDTPSKKLLYYEVSPSAVLIDQITPEYGGNHFLLLPYSWTKQVKELTNKTGGPFVYVFLLWLRSSYETIRRDNTHKVPHTKKKTRKSRKYEITTTFEELCQTLGVSESVYLNQRKRTHNGIVRAYNIALQTGYLTDVEDGFLKEPKSNKFKFYLNESFYPNPDHMEVEVEEVPKLQNLE